MPMKEERLAHLVLQWREAKLLFRPCLHLCDGFCVPNAVVLSVTAPVQQLLCDLMSEKRCVRSMPYKSSRVLKVLLDCQLCF